MQCCRKDLVKNDTLAYKTLHRYDNPVIPIETKSSYTDKTYKVFIGCGGGAKEAVIDWAGGRVTKAFLFKR